MNKRGRERKKVKKATNIKTNRNYVECGINVTKDFNYFLN